MKRIPIKRIKELAKELDQSHVVLFSHDKVDNLNHIVTYGDTIEHCSQAADMDNRLKKLLGWPDNLQEQPSRVRKLQDKVKQREDEIDRLVAYVNRLEDKIGKLRRFNREYI